MPDSPFVFAGAQVQPTAAASLHTNEFFSGLWTQGNPLGPGAVPYMYRNYAPRYDRIVGGANMELTTRLTPARRPGSSVYNPGPFPPINRFYEFRGFSAQGERIRIMASCDPVTGSQQGTVRDVTGPNTNLVIWTKDKNAGRTSFISVGNILYMGDGVNTKMLVESKRSWGVSATGITATIGAISSVQLYRVRLAPPPSSIQTIAVFTLTAPPAVTLVNGQLIELSGLTTLPTLNSKSFSYSPALSSFVPVGANQVALNVTGFYSLPMANTTETGTMTTQGATFNTGEFIVDPNNNVQEAVGAQIATITNIQVDSYTVGGSPGRLVTLFFSPVTPLDIDPGVRLTLAGLTTVPGLVGSHPVTNVENSLQVQFQVAGTSIPVTPYSVETGTAQTGNGISGPTQPAWATTPGAVTLDGGQQWVCKGPALEDWGFGSPATAPTVTQSAAPSSYGAWSADTWYAPLFVIEDPANNLQQLTTTGTTGTSIPTFSSTIGATTNDGTCVWTCLGPSAWQANHAYNAGDVILVSYTYYITSIVTKKYWDPDTNGWQWGPVEVSTPVNVNSLFEAQTSGTSGANQPNWSNGLNTTTQDNGVSWLNLADAVGWANIGASQKLSLETAIIDSNGYLEQIQIFGKSGSAAPTWADQGQTTTETPSGGATGVVWLNAGPYTAGSNGAWTYAYSGKSSVTGHVSTPSPLSTPITISKGNLAVIQGLGVPNPPEDRIVLWRTMAGGSTLFELDEIPNPGLGQPWTYTDTTPDLPANGSLGLNQQIQAPIANANDPASKSNDPPPQDFVPQAYYLGRIWGFEKNVLRYSNGPDAITGSGDQGFDARNQFTFPSMGVKCWATTIGLVCYTESDVWLIQGQGTASSPFYATNFQEGVGLANQDAFCVNGSTAYGMLTSGQVVSMDPGAGELEVGFPIGDLFNKFFSPSQTYCAWHQAASSDMALYVADGSTGWHRMAPVAAPEDGNVWSPKANIQGGVKAIASLEIVPGLKVLLLGPSVDGGPILTRDSSTNADNGVPYSTYFDIGSLVMAEPGSTVGMQYIVTEEAMIAGATPASVGLVFDEIVGPYLTLRNKSPDPPNLPRSKSVMVQRHWVGQDANTVQRCRFIQQRVSWPAENFPNELYTNTLYGRVAEKARK